MDYTLYELLDKFGLNLVINRCKKNKYVARIPGLMWSGERADVHARVSDSTPLDALFKLADKISNRSIKGNGIGIVIIGHKELEEWEGKV